MQAMQAPELIAIVKAKPPWDYSRITSKWTSLTHSINLRQGDLSTVSGKLRQGAHTATTRSRGKFLDRGIEHGCANDDAQESRAHPRQGRPRKCLQENVTGGRPSPRSETSHSSRPIPLPARKTRPAVSNVGYG